ncbi:MAG: hypothetical protein CMP14_01665 [Rickettsiales bacterium]|nr:hypothetical protein [Rickettsiales bacterium]|tara:strand:- start:551 stop:1642 length:1092 start_codon:yes stop_codon:yes gene_type:complete
MAIVNPLLGAVTSAISSPSTLWDPPGDPIDPEAEERERQERERREAAERERRALLSNPVDRYAGVPTIRSDMPDFQVGFHEGHPTMSTVMPFDAGNSEYLDFSREFYSDPANFRDSREVTLQDREKMAEAYAQSIYDARKAEQKRTGLFTEGLLSSPRAHISQHMEKPETQLGIMLGLAGVPFAGGLLETIGNINMKNQAYNRALALEGVPGYSIGMLDGQHYSTAPRGLMGHRVMYGTVPDWFDVEQADILENYQKGLDAEGNPTIDAGTARFSPDGFLSTPFGHDVATPDDVAALAKQYGVPYSEALDAVNRAERGDGTVDTNLTGKDPLGPAPIHIDDDDVVDDPHADFGDMMDEEHSPW